MANEAQSTENEAQSTEHEEHEEHGRVEALARVDFGRVDQYRDRRRRESDQRAERVQRQAEQYPTIDC